jgi:hypothetical protein
MKKCSLYLLLSKRQKWPEFKKDGAGRKEGARNFNRNGGPGKDGFRKDSSARKDGARAWNKDGARGVRDDAKRHARTLAKNLEQHENQFRFN